jgi:hypothetical protein
VHVLVQTADIFKPYSLSLWINGKNGSLQVVLQTSSGNCVPEMNESE